MFLALDIRFVHITWESGWGNGTYLHTHKDDRTYYIDTHSFLLRSSLYICDCERNRTYLGT